MKKLFCLAMLFVGTAAHGALLPEPAGWQERKEALDVLIMIKTLERCATLATDNSRVDSGSALGKQCAEYSQRVAAFMTEPYISGSARISGGGLK